MAEGIQLTHVNSRFYCYRCDHEISILSPTELTCPECSTGFIEEVPPDEYDDDDDIEEEEEEESDIDDSDLSMFNLFNVESLLRRTVVNLGEVESPTHSDHEPYEEAASPGDRPSGEIYNARRFIEDLENSFSQGPSNIRMRNLGDYLFGDDIDAISTLLLNESDIPGYPPLPSSHIKSLPTIIVCQKHVDEGIQCTICMEDFALRELAKNLPCDHFYHEACITPWLERHATCPNCRKPVKVNETQSINHSRRSQNRPPLNRSLSSESLISGRGRLRFAEERPSLGTIFTTTKEENGDRKNLISEKLSLVQKELDTAIADIQEKNSKIEVLKTEIDMRNQEVESLRQKASTNDELEEKFMSQNLELEAVRHLNGELLTKLDEIEMLKEPIEDTKNLISENLKLQDKLSIVQKKLDTALADIQDKNSKIEVLQNEIDMCNQEIESLKQKASAKDELEEKLMSQNLELEAVGHLNGELTDKLSEIKMCFIQHSSMLEIIQKCEIKASNKIVKLGSAIENHNSEIVYLQSQIKNKEASIEQLEKALGDLQEQLKNVQMEYEAKLALGKEQHEIEIKETMKLKHLVEEENINLKKETLKSNNLKPKSLDNKKTGGKADALRKRKTHSKMESSLKKNVDDKGKENIIKNFSTRTLRKREINFQETSFSSVGSDSPGTDNVKGRKRLSDEDFEPSVNKASNKMKSGSSKIPAIRQPRKKLKDDEIQTISPIQKLANSIASKMKGFPSNLPYTSSPRLTRGRKKLFNVVAPIACSENAKKGKK